MKNKKVALWTASLCSVALVMGLVACAPQQSGTEKPKDEPQQQQVETPAADEYGVVTADSWKDAYPNQYATYKENEANSPDSGKHNYLELYPALNTMYKGYAFALGYDEASSHLYTLKSVSETPRTTQKEQMANCITCKTPQFTRLVETEGDEVYTRKFNDTIGQFTEPISCYNCHENDPQTLNVTGQYFVKSLGPDYGEDSAAPMGAQVCGQCHNEYYFDPETKVTSNPYTGLEAMTPDAILAYYDEMGFKDWAHKGISPLENQELLDSTCSSCHTDLKGQVAAWQAEEEERVTAISEKIEDMTNKIAAKYADEISAIKAAEEAGNTQAPSEELAALQKLQRNAQFYWDFVMVENSEGVHNPELTMETLDKAEAAADEALAML